MDRRNFSNIGDELKDIVQDAVNTMDFHQLNRDIGNTVNGALDEVRRSIGLNRNGWQGRSGLGGGSWNNPNQNNQNGSNPYQNNQNRSNPNQNWNNSDRRARDRRNTYGNPPNWNNRTSPYQFQQNVSSNIRNEVQRYKNMPVTKYTVPIGKVSGMLLSILGGIGTGVFGIAIFVLGILSSALQIDIFNYIITGLLLPLVGSVFMSVRGGTLRKRLKRFNQYVGVLRSRNYCTIKELSRSSDLSDKYLIKDLRKMIGIGMFPEGHIDDQRTCFMLNNESYDQYLKLQDNMKSQQDQERVAQQEKKEQEGQPSKDPEFVKAIEEGKSYVRQIREANDAIPGQEISEKLYRLENVTSKIFDYVETHPNQLSEIQKFMSYYLPTTSKLLNAYKEFDRQPVQGENITSAKKEIESTLDTINLAFENLLDSLFEDAAMDVSTDISVLQSMLKQEGLTEKDF